MYVHVGKHTCSHTHKYVYIDRQTHRIHERMNTGCVASSSITSSELLDLITTTQWKSLELMPRPEWTWGLLPMETPTTSVCAPRLTVGEVSYWLGKTLIGSLDSGSFNSAKSGVDVGKENTLLLLNGHDPSALLDLSRCHFPIYWWICFCLPSFLLISCLFALKAFCFLSVLEVLCSSTKQVLAG